MAWRGIDTPAKCLEVIEAAGRSNAGFLVDALHFDRCGGEPSDLAAMPPARIVSAQLCDGPGTRPTTNKARLAEARGGRLLPGDGELPLRKLVAALPEHAVVSVEIPMATDPRTPEARARDIHAATMCVLQERVNAIDEAPR
jgi:sugar phosphate isomerase/epimerase